MEKPAGRNSSVDVLKGISIIFIIILHFGWEQSEPYRFLFPFWAEMAVPIFMILSGYVYAFSYRKRNVANFGDAYNVGYIIEKIIRYTLPFAFAYLIEVLYRIFVNKDAGLGFGDWLKMFVTGGVGPGSYYYPIMLQFVLIFPLCFFLIHKYDIGGLAAAFCACILFEVLQYAVKMDGEIYRLLIFRYLFAIAGGCYLAIGKRRLGRVWRILAMIAGALWITLVNYRGIEFPVIRPEWAGTCFLATLWILPIVSFLLQKKLHARPIEFLGKASYNIFLTQLVIYAYGSWVVYKYIQNRVLQFGVLTVAILVSGLIFYLFESRLTTAIITAMRKRRKN